MLLILCILCNVWLAISFKSFPKYKINNYNAIIVNYFVCMAVATYLKGDLPFTINTFSESWFPYALLLGVFFILGFNLIALSYQYFGISFTVIVQRMSLIFPVIFSIAFYSESLGIFKILGLFLAFASIVLINYKKTEKSTNKVKPIYLALPFFILFTTGFIEIVLFYVQRAGISNSVNIEFVGGIFTIAGILGTTYLLFLLLFKNHKFHFRDFIAGLLLGIPNFFTIYLLIVLLDQGWEGSILFPLNNISVVILSTMLGIILFAEKLSKQQWLGFILAVGSIYTLAQVS